MQSRKGLLKLFQFILFFLVSQLWIAESVNALDYAIGADLSFLKQAEDRGTVF